MVFSEGGPPLRFVRVDFFEDAVTFLEKEGAVEEITSSERIYQAYLDLERATDREVFEHINPDITELAVPLSTIENKTTELKSAGLIEEVDKDGNAPGTGQRPERAPGGSPGRGRVGGKDTPRPLGPIPCASRRDVPS
jgi:hypothetical protein